MNKTECLINSFHKEDSFCFICPMNKNKNNITRFPFCDYISELFINLMTENITEKEAENSKCPLYVEKELYKWNK